MKLMLVPGTVLKGLMENWKAKELFIFNFPEILQKCDLFLFLLTIWIKQNEKLWFSDVDTHKFLFICQPPGPSY